MARSTLLVAVGAVLGGIAVLMLALAAAFEPLLVFVALPFAAAGYIVWYQGTGRLAARIRREAVADDEPGRRAAGTSDAGPRSGDPRWADPRAQAARARARRRAAGASVGREADAGGFDPRGRAGSRDRRAGGDAAPFEDRMSEREAREILGVEPGSDETAVREAYRDRVKETHPDTEDGDEETFKRVAEAYERLDGH